MIIDELVGFSNLYGSNEELVLAGGGNTSAKDGDVMYIKGSGTRLADITADGFVKMSRSKIAEIFTKTYPDNDKEREALSLADLMAAKLPDQETKDQVLKQHFILFSLTHSFCICILHLLTESLALLMVKKLQRSFLVTVFCGLSHANRVTPLQKNVVIH